MLLSAHVLIDTHGLHGTAAASGRFLSSLDLAAAKLVRAAEATAKQHPRQVYRNGEPAAPAARPSAISTAGAAAAAGRGRPGPASAPVPAGPVRSGSVGSALATPAASAPRPAGNAASTAAVVPAASAPATPVTPVTAAASTASASPATPRAPSPAPAAAPARPTEVTPTAVMAAADDAEAELLDGKFADLATLPDGDVLTDELAEQLLALPDEDVGSAEARTGIDGPLTDGTALPEPLLPVPAPAPPAAPAPTAELREAEAPSPTAPVDGALPPSPEGAAASDAAVELAMESLVDGVGPSKVNAPSAPSSGEGGINTQLEELERGNASSDDRRRWIRWLKTQLAASAAAEGDESPEAAVAADLRTRHLERFVDAAVGLVRAQGRAGDR